MVLLWISNTPPWLKVFIQLSGTARRHGDGQMVTPF
jgi:hypothetical protein